MASAYNKSRMAQYITETEIADKLKAMLNDDSYHTLPGYSIDTDKYPNNEVPFLEEHLNYLKKHPQVDPSHYLSNLRLMLKIR